MTAPVPDPPEHDVLPPETGGALSVPPPVPQKKPGFLRRLFMSRRKQQALAMQHGYLEMVDLIRAIRSHLDRQETVQSTVLGMLAKVPAAMDRQHEVMTMFKQQLENSMENNRRLTDSMGNLNNTLASIDESQRASSRTITDLIGRSRESEQLLREVMRRSERRMTVLLVIFFLLVAGLGFYFFRWQDRNGTAPEPEAKPVAAVPAPGPDKTIASAQPAAGKEAPVGKKSEKEPGPKSAAGKPEPEPAAPAISEVQAAPPAKEAKAPKTPRKKDKAKSRAKAEEQTAAASVPPAAEQEAPAVGQPDLTLDQIKQVVGDAIGEGSSPVPADQPPVSMP